MFDVRSSTIDDIRQLSLITDETINLEPLGDLSTSNCYQP